jgi:hypothetical protein
MLLVGSALKGYSIEASDGKIGTVSDLLFDDRTWKLRWLVVDTGNWLPGRRVLLHPSVVGEVDYERRALAVRLTKAQVEASPNILQDRPVSMQMEESLHNYYGWDPTWGSSYFGLDAMGLSYSPSRAFAGPMMHENPGTILRSDDGDPHLRSIESVIGYHIHATDGDIGHAENFLISDDGWGIRYLIIDTRNWWPGQHVLMSPYAIREINWPEHQIRLDATRDRVKASPPWDPLAIVDRIYEKRLHTHYDWPGYGW